VKHWIKIEAKWQEAPVDWSVYTEVFEHHGISTTQQQDSPPTLTGYIGKHPTVNSQVEALQKDLTNHGAIEIITSCVEDQEWSHLWQQFFKPREIGRRWLLCPTWETPPPSSERLLIVLDPGQAFGTGEHATTRMCLELLEKAHIQDKEVADIGCGSGILSIGACLLGARKVIAVDNDPTSVEVSKENAVLNKVHYETLLGNGFDPISKEQKFDVILSNIISAAILQLIPKVIEQLRPGGEWIVSGILQQNWPEVRLKVEKAGFEWVHCTEEDEWIAAICRR
jgi:ribosomal protein L11 methyltransferase